MNTLKLYLMCHTMEMCRLRDDCRGFLYWNIDSDCLMPGEICNYYTNLTCYFYYIWGLHYLGLYNYYIILLKVVFASPCEYAVSV